MDADPALAWSFRFRRMMDRVARKTTRVGPRLLRIKKIVVTLSEFMAAKAALIHLFARQSAEQHNLVGIPSGFKVGSRRSVAGLANPRCSHSAYFRQTLCVRAMFIAFGSGGMAVAAGIRADVIAVAGRVRGRWLLST